jgi:hypothetical protein
MRSSDIFHTREVCTKKLSLGGRCEKASKELASSLFSGSTKDSIEGKSFHFETKMYFWDQVREAELIFTCIFVSFETDYFGVFPLSGKNTPLP